MNDVDIEQQVRDLAAHLATPTVPVADDLARGVVRRRRRLALTAGVAASVAAVTVAGVGFAAFDRGGADRSGQRSDIATTTPSVSPDPTGSPTGSATGNSTGNTTGTPGPATRHRPSAAQVHAVFLANRRAAAHDLDPSGTHLSAREIGRVDQDGNERADGTWADGEQQLAWRTPGSSGLADVTIGVAVYDKWTGFCHQGLHCSPLPGNAAVTRIEPSPIGPLTYVYTRPSDHYTITLQVEGHDKDAASGTAVDLTDAEIAASLTDSRLGLPGHPTVPVKR